MGSTSEYTPCFGYVSVTLSATFHYINTKELSRMNYKQFRKVWSKQLRDVSFILHYLHTFSKFYELDFEVGDLPFE